MKNNNRYEHPLIGYLIIGINLAVGMTFLILTAKKGIEAGHSIIVSILSTSILLPYTLLFLFIFIYMIDMHINNIFKKPKEEILYAYCTDKGDAIFLDKKGHKYVFSNSKSKIEQDKFYKVLKTRDEIDEVLEITSPNYDIPELKERFWLTWYIPFFGSMKDVMLLPIVYTIFFMGILSCMVGDLSMLIMLLLTGVLIAYDLYFKFLVKKNRDTIKNESIDEIELIEKRVNNELEPTMIKIENTAINIKNTIVFIILTLFIIFLIGVLIAIYVIPDATDGPTTKISFTLFVLFFIGFLIAPYKDIIKVLFKKR